MFEFLFNMDPIKLAVFAALFFTALWLVIEWFNPELDGILRQEIDPFNPFTQD